MATVRESTLEQLAITTIRTLAMDAVEQAQSGHPGLPMGAAPMAYVLWTDFLKHNPADPAWPDRDRFVLSAGHGSMLLYALLHLTGYDLPLEELKRFRQWGSKTPGHPEYGLTPGVETTTGPLGQGIATAVGMALAERFLAARYNRPDLPIVDHMTYVLAGDGDLMEGVSGEASSLAGHLGLGKLVVLYDDNHVSIEGATDLAFTEDVLARYAAYGWHTQRVADGNDLDAIRAALEAARTVTDRPSIIAVRTHIGYGSPHKQDSASSHGAPLGQEEVKLTKEAYGWPVEPPFYVPEEVRSFMARARETGARRQAEWEALWEHYRAAYPQEAAELARTWEHTLPAGWDQDLPQFEPGKKIATRSASGQVLNVLAQRIPTLIGGSADLAPSNNTLIKGEADQSAAHPEGRNLHFGVREHAMGAMLNGMSLHGLRVYGGTFLVFANYMRPAIRLAALMHQPVTYVFTHDSIGLGEDGPTHQPIE
ncbi:MAG: transketolase, partial [Firmicutes bacterium]|nr:transketolase [Bacillota bacterium]